MEASTRSKRKLRRNTVGAPRLLVLFFLQESTSCYRRMKKRTHVLLLHLNAIIQVWYVWTLAYSHMQVTRNGCTPIKEDRGNNRNFKNYIKYLLELFSHGGSWGRCLEGKEAIVHQRYMQNFLDIYKKAKINNNSLECL